MRPDDATDAEAALLVSVVIPARNAEATLGAQLQALAAQESAPPFEVVVVDNASTDGTARVAREWCGVVPNLRVVECTEPGLNRARNTGVRAAHANALAICDADDAVGPGWVAAMKVALDEFDIVAGRLDTIPLNDDFVCQTREVPAADRLPAPFWGLPYAVGANMGFRRSVFDRVDGFAPDMHGAEEMDFCWRAQYAGCSIGYAPDAVVAYRLRSRLRDALRQYFVYARGNAQLRAVHIALGRLPRQTRRQQGSLVKKYLYGLAHVERLHGPVSRRRYLQDMAWFAGCLAGLLRYRAMA